MSEILESVLRLDHFEGSHSRDLSGARYRQIEIHDCDVATMTIEEAKELLLDLFADYIFVAEADRLTHKRRAASHGTPLKLFQSALLFWAFSPLLDFY